MLKEILLKHINRSIFLESLVSDMGHYFLQHVNYLIVVFIKILKYDKYLKYKPINA